MSFPKHGNRRSLRLLVYIEFHRNEFTKASNFKKMFFVPLRKSSALTNLDIAGLFESQKVIFFFLLSKIDNPSKAVFVIKTNPRDSKIHNRKQRDFKSRHQMRKTPTTPVVARRTVSYWTTSMTRNMERAFGEFKSKM